MARIWNKHKQTNTPLKRKVFVAMSGGVDSSVAAAILKKQGYDVVGVFMRFWSEPTTDYGLLSAAKNTNTCCSEGAEQAARNVAAKLKVPFYILNVQKEFKKAVVDYFLAEEKKGRTPNPCVVCNKKIKFGLLFEKAMAMGADFVATGHYARVARKFKVQSSKFKVLSQNLKLFKAKDGDKDQSYFLYNLKQKQLERILFPVGDFKKDEVYQMAKKWRLPYRKEESFDLCFVANDREGFLKKYLKMRNGKIIKFTNKTNFIKNVTEKNLPQPLLKEGGSLPLGRVRDDLNFVLGKHNGLALYTIGQRKNIPIGKGPWWVVKKDEKNNILYVSNNEKDLYSRELVATGVNWISGAAFKPPIKVWAKIRYKSETSPAVIRRIASSADREHMVRVIFIKPQRAVTSGQSVVFYLKAGEVLGGGIIS